MSWSTRLRDSLDYWERTQPEEEAYKKSVAIADEIEAWEQTCAHWMSASTDERHAALVLVHERLRAWTNPSPRAYYTFMRWLRQQIALARADMEREHGEESD